ncbi:MAG: hypothetical protein LBV06_08425 [Propionibacteriaceae bacterium]|jgi:hypothetical protein|nr:hypothetical protein [Propionibacteriaceae bacterium]
MVHRGRYAITANPDESGNLHVYDTSGRLKVNKILGGDYDVPKAALTLVNGEKTQIRFLPKARFI